MAARQAMLADVAVIYGVPRAVDPIDGLVEEYHRTMGIIEALEAMVYQLSPSELFYGVLSVEETSSPDPEGGEDLAPPERKTRSGPALNLQVRLLNEERDRAVKIAETIIKLDLEGRRVNLAQGHIALMVQILLHPDLGLSQDQRRTAARLLRVQDQAAIEGTVVA